MLLPGESFSGIPSTRQCTTLAMTVPWAQSHRKMIALIFWIMILTLHNINAQWPVRVVDGAEELTPCEGLGFPNATLSQCGYCTLGSTGLLANYSVDCNEACEGKAVVDCNGQCGGTAYIDECSGQCIGGDTGLTEANVESYRDCRGYCTSAGGQFYKDECGVCHTGTSPFQDCTKECHLPGFEHEMAQMLCGRCVGADTDVPISDIIDACGNCKSDTVECHCDGKGKPDECGDCNGGGKACLKVVDFNPKVLPAKANTNANIVIVGAFKGRTKNLKCLFIHDESGNVTESNGSGNGTQVTCPAKLKAGTYRVGVRLDNTSPPETGYVEEKELFIYDDALAEYTSMSPINAVFDREVPEALIVRFSGGKVPNLPLICNVVGEGWPKSQKLSPSEPNTLDSCSIPYPKSSMKLSITPSFNGIHLFKKSFDLKFYASPPDMQESYIAEDGHAAIITFDRPVNLCDLKNCTDMLTDDSLEQIGRGAVCEWATKQQLIITVQNQITTNPLRITFKKGVLKQDGQKYARSKDESRTVDVYYPRPVSNAQLTISGPSTVPFCGTFTLVGHFASPKGDAQYYWTAYRGNSGPIEAAIANALLGVRTSSLSLNASLLEVDLNYTFILTAEHPVNEKYEARHDVLRLQYVGPLVTAYSNVMSQPYVTVDQRITLYAEVSLPDCSSETEIMNLMWTVNNPKVKFNFKDRDKVMYVVEPYSLPENSEVIFAAKAFFANYINVTSSRVVLRVEAFKLKATIKGNIKRIVGNKAGNLALESEVATLDFPVVYQWKCYEENTPICYNYMKDSTEPLLVPRSMQSLPNLVIPCASLKANQTLTFELQVFNANNRYQYSPVATTYVMVVDKDIPQVVIDSVVADGIHYIERYPNTGAYSIPAGLPVSIYATFTKASSKFVKWDVKGFSSSFTFTAVNGKTVLSLEEGFLIGHGIYLVGLSACDGKGNCGIANLTIHAVPGVALCKLEAEPFVEYEMVNAEVKGCSIPLGRQPVTYQIILQTPETDFPLTVPQTPTVFNFLGPAYRSSKGSQLSVEVCDKYSLCKKFPGPQLKVRKSERLLEDKSMVLSKAKQAQTINDPLSALSYFLAVTSGPDAQITVEEANEILSAGKKATENRYINAGELALIYSSMLPLVKHENNEIKTLALSIIRKGTNLAYAHEIKIPSATLTQGYSIAAEALEAKKTDARVISNVRLTLENFVEKISKTASLGNRVQLFPEKPGFPSSLVFRQLLDSNPMYIKAMTKNGTVSGSVKFEEAIRDRVRKRACTGDRCEGIVVALTLYPDKSPYPSQMKKTSPIMEITLRQPENGEPFSVSDVTNSIKLALTHNATPSDTPGILYRCSYWDSSSNDWLQDGLVSYGEEAGMMRCWSSHLTAFAVVETLDGLSAGSIVGIVVTVLMGVFIIMMLAFFYFRKKLAAKSRVSSEALQPKRLMDKKGMNGSHVRVKTVTP